MWSDPETRQSSRHTRTSLSMRSIVQYKGNTVEVGGQEGVLKKLRCRPSPSGFQTDLAFEQVDQSRIRGAHWNRNMFSNWSSQQLVFFIAQKYLKYFFRLQKHTRLYRRGLSFKAASLDLFLTVFWWNRCSVHSPTVRRSSTGAMSSKMSFA